MSHRESNDHYWIIITQTLIPVSTRTKRGRPANRTSDDEVLPHRTVTQTEEDKQRHRHRKQSVVSARVKSRSVAETRQTCASKWARNTHVSSSPAPGSARSQPPSPASASSYNNPTHSLSASARSRTAPLLYTVHYTTRYTDTVLRGIRWVDYFAKHIDLLSCLSYI